MNNNIMLIDAVDASEVRVVVLQDGDVEHFDFISKAKQQIKGNIYLGKITRVEPSLQAAFVEYGGDKQGFLSFSEIHPDYYQIPVEDRQKLLEEVARMAELENAEFDEEDAIDASDATKPKPEKIKATEVDGAKERASKVRKRGGRRKTLGKKNVELNEDANLIASVAQEEPQSTDHDGSETPQAMTIESENEVIISEEVLEENLETNDAGEPIQSEEAPANLGKDEVEEMRGNNLSLLRRYKIQEVIKPGQLVLVQVIKEERGNKGVSLSSYISLAGRYCVVMPNSPKGGGISRKIGSSEDRKRLREISDELKELRGMSAIIRTAGLDRTKAEIKRDYEYLIKLWNQVREDALASIAPALVYEENDIIKRSIRDHYDSHLEGILVHGEAAYRKAKEFMKLLMPSHAPKIKQYKQNAPLFAEYGVESMLSELYRPIAPLKSGGYLVINPTEALISVDVNSGRSTNEKNVEETAYRTNLEACDELARQLRLRNLGGLIVVDFIDMAYHKYRRNVEKALKDAMKNDRAKIQIGSISTFGLMELSRQRIGSSLEESTTHTCGTCGGSGRVPRADAIILQLLRNLQYFLSEQGEQGIIINVAISQGLMLEMLNNNRAALEKMAEEFKVSFAFEIHPENNDSVYCFKGKGAAKFESVQNNERKAKFAGKNKKNRNNKRERPENKSRDEVGELEVEELQPAKVEETPVPAADGVVKKSRRRGKRGGKNQQRRNVAQNAVADGESIENNNQLGQPQQVESVFESDSKVETLKPIVNDFEIAPIKIVQDNKVDEAEQIAPKNKTQTRKGWWQRVLDA